MIGWRSSTESEEILCDAAAAQCAESGFMQSSAWAEFKRAEGYIVNRLVLEADGQVRGSAQLLAYPGEGVTVCPEGPVLPWEDAELCRLALRGLVEHVRSSVALGLRIEPHLELPAPSLLRNWSRAAVDLTPAHTLMVDLTAGHQELQRRMHPKARYNIGVAERHGVVVRQSQEPADARRFHELFMETANRNGFFYEPLGFFLNLSHTLLRNDLARFLFAEREGELLAAMILLVYGRRATYLYGASSTKARYAMPNYALHWEAIKVAKAEGCLEYDLYGYDPFNQPNHLYAGISRFKKQWGGRRRSWIGARDFLFYDRVADKVIERLTP